MCSVKPLNILVAGGLQHFVPEIATRTPQEITAKLCDFGIATAPEHKLKFTDRGTMGCDSHMHIPLLKCPVQPMQ